MVQTVIGRVRVVDPQGTVLLDLPTLRDLQMPLSVPLRGETWRGLPEWPNYAVSSRGRVWSIRKRIVLRQMLAPSQTYPSVMLPGQHRAQVRRSVHSLMARAFYGPRPEGKIVAHADDVPTHNVIENLRYATNAENQADAARHDPNHPSNRSACPRGHLLVDPNLVEAQKKRGCRNCKSCHRAAAYYQYLVRSNKPVIARVVLADRYYAELGFEVAAVAA